MGRPTDAPIEIAPGIVGQVWENLHLDDPHSNDWDCAIEILNRRIRGRFLEPADNIACLPFGGFAVMALDCLLIETLEQFKRGVHETGEDESNRRGAIKRYFVNFLTDKDLGLGAYFDENLAGLNSVSFLL